MKNLQLQKEFDRKMFRLSKSGLKIRRHNTRELIFLTEKKFFPITATNLAIGLGVRLDSLSGLLTRMVKDGSMQVVNKFGVRGGNGYIPTKFLIERKK